MLKEEFEKKEKEFEEKFLKSQEYLKLKECDKALYEDRTLRPFLTKKKKLEEDISLAYSNDENKYKLLLTEYKDLLSKMNDIPSVKAYNQAFDNLKQVKAVFDKELLVKLL